MYDNIIVETKWKIHKLSNEGHCVPLIATHPCNAKAYGNITNLSSLMCVP